MIPLKDNIPTRRFAALTVALILINVFVYFVLQEGRFSTVNNERVVEYGVIPYELTHQDKHCVLVAEGIGCADADQLPDQPNTWLTILTSMFMHGSLLHLAGNMLFLWIFGNNIEDSMGRLRFIAFYLGGGLVAVLAQTLANPDAAVPTVGASGAIAAVLGGYAILYPRARVVTLVFIVIFITLIELPALVVLGLWFLLQVLYGASDALQPVSSEGGVAYFAHIGGFVFGLLLVKLFANKVHDDYETANRIPVY